MVCLTATLWGMFPCLAQLGSSARLPPWVAAVTVTPGAYVHTHSPHSLPPVGVEGVFVVWRVDTGVPTFLPRLGGPLLGVSANPADPAKYLVRQADNTLRIINTATLKVGGGGTDLLLSHQSLPFQTRL